MNMLFMNMFMNRYYLYMRRQYPDLSKNLTKAFLDDEAKNDLRPP